MAERLGSMDGVEGGIYRKKNADGVYWSFPLEGVGVSARW